MCRVLQGSIERAVENRRSDLKKVVGATCRPAHLVAAVHPLIDDDVYRQLRRRRRHALAGPLPPAVVDQPAALAVDVLLQPMQQVRDLPRPCKDIAAPMMELV